MPTEQALTLYEGNDEKLNFTITSNVEGFTLVGTTIEVFLKVSAATPDGDAGVWKGSTVGGLVVIDDSDSCHANVPNTAVTTTKGWYRCDVISGGLRKTAAYGTVSVVDL